MAPASEHSGRSAVVTGAGGGLGRDIALGLAAKGYIVFGTAFSAGEVSDLKEASGGRVSLTVCDITKEQAVKTWAAGVSEALGGSGLDLLINNAGILTPGPIEVLPLDAIRTNSTSMFSAPYRSSTHSCQHSGRLAVASFRSALGPPACRCRSTDHRAHLRRRWKCLRRSTAPS